MVAIAKELFERYCRQLRGTPRILLGTIRMSDSYIGRKAHGSTRGSAK